MADQRVHMVYGLTNCLITVFLIFPIIIILCLFLFYSSPGYEKIVPGEGMPLSKAPEHKGNLVIRFDIEFPKQLIPEKKHLVKEALL